MEKLKILVFEYITGGGLSQSGIPGALAREGLLMLQALVDTLSLMDNVEPCIMMDFRVVEHLKAKPDYLHLIGSRQDCNQEFIRLMDTCDAVWPIAPENDVILQSLCEAVERSGKMLLNSSSSTVAITGNKWLTYKVLQQHSIPTIPTHRLVDFCFTQGEWILKPVDGVGCGDSYLITNLQEFNIAIFNLERERYLVQPHVQGEKISLSCLFKEGRGWLLCANLQLFEVIDKQYHLTGITVNFTPRLAKYQNLVNVIAQAMPGLWGYVGIDLIETADQIFVLEINPRLTTSYAGIYNALGINCASAVVDLLTGDPTLEPTRNQSVYINVAGYATGKVSNGN